MCVSLTVASIGLSAMGAMQEARAKKQQADYQKQVQTNNAIIAQRNAIAIQKAGSTAAEERGARTRQVIGAAKASMAASGLLVDDEIGTTPAALLDDLSAAGALDVQRLYAKASAEAHRALVQKENFEAQAGMFDLQARSINPMFAGLTTAARGTARHADILFA